MVTFYGEASIDIGDTSWSRPFTAVIDNLGSREGNENGNRTMETTLTSLLLTLNFWLHCRNDWFQDNGIDCVKFTLYNIYSQKQQPNLRDVLVYPFDLYDLYWFDF